MKKINPLTALILLINFQNCSFGNNNNNEFNFTKNVITRTEKRDIINQIILNPEMVISNCGCYGASPIANLVDEQNTQIARNEFMLPTDMRYNKAQFIIDLKNTFQLSKISAFELAGSWRGKDTIFIYTGNPNKWKLNGIIITERNKDQWSSINLTDSSRFVMLEFNIKINDIEEIVLFGNKISNNEVIKPVFNGNKNYPTFDKLMGATGGLWENENLMQCVSSLREFHSWNWNDGGIDEKKPGYTIPNYPEYPNNYFIFNPDYSNRHTDEDYKRLTNAGIELNPCLQTSAYYFTNGENENIKPLIKGNNPNNPESYKAHADYLFQYTARYGNTKVDDSKLKLYKKGYGPLNEFQPRVSGLNLVKSVENWNEPDKWWHSFAATFTPFEFAAMCSADYDGHEKKLGVNVGVKNADSTMKVVMGGLASLNIDYIKGMKLWTEFNRTEMKKFPADVLNFHHYCNKFINGQPTIGISPEEDHLKDKLKKIVAFRDSLLPNLEIWLSEFGYDTQVGSFQAAPAIKKNSTEEIQGRWLLRSFLEISASGIDKAFVYNLDDYGTNTTIQYLTSGLVKSAPNNEKKIAWYYVAGLKSLLKNYYFFKEIPSGNKEINIYAFKSNNSSKIIYALWCNSSNNKEVFNYKFNIKGSENAIVFKPIAKNSFHLKENIKSTSNIFNIEKISELPIFIEVNN